MKRTWTLLLVGGVGAVCWWSLAASQPAKPSGAAGGGAPLAIDNGPVSGLPAPPEGAIVFELKYRGLNAGPEEMRYNSFWGFGSSGGDQSPFGRAVKEKVRKPHFVHNFMLKGREWSAVEFKDRQIEAFYFDLNRNGKLEAEERILPASRRKDGASETVEFVTPDFLAPTKQNGLVPFRVLLQARTHGSSGDPNCMWSPSCVLEGAAALEGTPMKLVLFTHGFEGVFDQFGQCDYALLPAQKETGQYIPRQLLSSVVNHQGRFYRLSFQGRRPQGHVVRAVLIPDTTPTGEIAVELAGEQALVAAFRSLRLQGTGDQTIHFDLEGGRMRLPTGEYMLLRGQVGYGTAKDDEWEVGFESGPKIGVPAGEVLPVRLGQLKLAVRAMKEENRYTAGAKEESVYARGAKIYLTPRVSGGQGEVFNRFTQRSASPGRSDNRPPQIRIARADGKEVLVKTLEYG